MTFSTWSRLLGVLVLHDPGDDVLQVGDPHHVVGGLAGDRDAGEAAAQRERQRLVERLVALEEHHVGARHHDLADDRVAELDHRADHLPLARLDLVLRLDVVDQVLAPRGGRSAPGPRPGRRTAARRSPRRAAATPGRARRAAGAAGGGPWRRPVPRAAAHGARPHADQHVPRDEQHADRRQEHLPAAAEPVREGQGDENRAGYLGAHPDQRQQAAVTVKPVGVGPWPGPTARPRTSPATMIRAVAASSSHPAGGRSGLPFPPFARGGGPPAS